MRTTEKSVRNLKAGDIITNIGQIKKIKQMKFNGKLTTFFSIELEEPFITNKTIILKGTMEVVVDEAV